MRPTSPRPLLAVWTSLAAAVVVSCGDCGAPPAGNPDAKQGVPSDADLVLVFPDIGAPDTGECQVSTDCDAGACFSGMCCHSAAAVCSGTCCPEGTACLFGECVTPGKACHTSADCAKGQYCETALGGGVDAGVKPKGDAAACSQPLPLGGRCLDRPAVCEGGEDAACVPKCEYRTSADKPLEAVPRWSWGPAAREFPDFTDVWSTPTVGRVYDANCDGRIDELDPPNVVFVSGNVQGTCCGCLKDDAGLDVVPSTCHTGVLRVLDGRSGKEIWSLDRLPGSIGFMGLSLAIGDVVEDAAGDHRMEIVAVTAEGHVVILSGSGELLEKSDVPLPNAETTGSFGWGGGLSIADMDGDGKPEIAYAWHVFSRESGSLKLLFSAKKQLGGNQALSTFVDLDGDDKAELLTGKSAYRWPDGGVYWTRTDKPFPPETDGGTAANFPEGFPGVGDLDKDGVPEVVHVAQGHVWLMKSSDGTDVVPPVLLEGSDVTGGGPPTIADFDGDGYPEIGVAQESYYFVLKPVITAGAITALNVVLKKPNHDLSSSITGSTVFDFEGDGKAEVIYGDECFLWVFQGGSVPDGGTARVRFAAPHTSFTGTEASLVADVDGDGRAEILMVSNGASPTRWKCLDSAGTPTTVDGVTWEPGPGPNKEYRGITVFGDQSNSWVGTRALWNQHTYHVTNICDPRDSACPSGSAYGTIPTKETKSWTKGWLNNFRQNVQDKGLFDAPDVTVSLAVDCTTQITARVAVRNAGVATLPAGVVVGLFSEDGSSSKQEGTVTTTQALGSGQTEELSLPVSTGSETRLMAKVLVDPKKPLFHQCREDNDQTFWVSAACPD